MAGSTGGGRSWLPGRRRSRPRVAHPEGGQVRRHDTDRVNRPAAVAQEMDAGPQFVIQVLDWLTPTTASRPSVTPDRSNVEWLPTSTNVATVVQSIDLGAAA